MQAKAVYRTVRRRYNLIARGRGALVGADTFLARESRISNHRSESSAICIGDHCVVRGHLITYAHGGRISIGDWCYIGHRTEIWSMVNITIGHRVLIAHDVNIHDGNAHPRDAQQRHRHFKAISTIGHPPSLETIGEIPSAPVTIGDDVWISFGVTILKGITIGPRSIIAAGSMVTSDVPADSVFSNIVDPMLRPLWAS